MKYVGHFFVCLSRETKVNKAAAVAAGAKYRRNSPALARLFARLCSEKCPHAAPVTHSKTHLLAQLSNPLKRSAQVTGFPFLILCYRLIQDILNKVN